ncbi:MAG: TetR/AcrR family transcriptional regulator [Bacteroidota bacterium]
MPRIKRFDETAILEKAMHLFWQKGYHATSIQDLVNHLGINRASLYSTYGDKKALFVQAFQHYRQMNHKSIQAFFAAHPNIREGFRKLFDIALREAIESPTNKGCFVVNTTTEMLPDDESTQPLVAENQAAFVALFHDYLSRGLATGQLSSEKNLQAIALLFFTQYNGLRVITKATPEIPNVEAAIDSLLQLLD